MAQNLAQDEDGNIWEVDAQGNAVRLVQQGGQTSQPNIIPPNPARVAQEQAEAQRKAAADARAAASEAREQARFNERNQAAAPAGFRYKPDGSLERIPGGPKDEAGNPEVTAATRANAINAFNATRQLDGLIADIERQYNLGPGATRGLYGAQDYLPTPTNRRFDAAGNAVRGPAITALGFTSGQTNTPREVELNIGPYIPAAGDFDEVIVDKIARLKDLRDRSRVQAATFLGGVPTGNGRIVPLNELSQRDRDNLFPPGTLQPLDFGGPDGGNGAGSGAATPPDRPIGPDGRPRLAADEQVLFGTDTAPVTGARLNREQEAQVVGALRQGNREQAASLLEQFTGNPRTPETLRSLDAAAENLRRNPNASIGFNYGAADQAAQTAAERERYGDYLAPEIAEREADAGMGAFGSGARGFAQGLTFGAAPYIAAAGQAALGPETFADRLQRARATLEADNRVNPFSSLGGELAGSVASIGGLGAGLTRAAPRFGSRGAFLANPLTTDAIYGGATAGLNSDGNPASTAVGGVLGFGGGAAGRGLARGLGNVVGGVGSEAVRSLRQAGVPLTAGQTLGGVAKGLEDRVSGLPFIGDIVRTRRLEGMRGFNQAAFDNGLAPINGSTGGRIGEEGVDAARAARSQAYDNALDGVTVQADAPFVGDMRSTLAAGRALPEPMAGNADFTLNTRVGNSFSPTGELSGRDYQQALRGLRRDSSSLAQQPYGYDFGQVTNQAENALEGLLNRQAPGVVPAYQAANRANRNVEVLRDAVNRARNGTRTGETGVFSPSQLSDAAAANSRRFGNTQGTTQQPFFDLTRQGQEVLPNSVPDSGTAGRLATLALPGVLGGVGGGVGYAGGDAQAGIGTGLAVGGLLAAGGSRPAQRALVAALVDRPDALRTIGSQINNRARLGGLFGAPLLGSGVPYLVPTQ